MKVRKKYLKDKRSSLHKAIRKRYEEYKAWTGIEPGTLYVGTTEFRELIKELSTEDKRKLTEWPPEPCYFHGMRIFRVSTSTWLDVSWKGNHQWKRQMYDRIREDEFNNRGKGDPQDQLAPGDREEEVWDDHGTDGPD